MNLNFDVDIDIERFLERKKHGNNLSIFYDFLKSKEKIAEISEVPIDQFSSELSASQSLRKSVKIFNEKYGSKLRLFKDGKKFYIVNEEYI